MDKSLLLNALEAFIAKVDPDWKTLHRIADAKAPSVKAAFLKAVAETQGTISLKQVEEALSAGNILAAESLIDWTRFEPEMGLIGKILTGVMTESAEFSAESMGRKIGFKPIVFEGFKPNAPAGEIVGFFNLRNPAAEAWIKEHTGLLITQVTDETKKAVRSIILDGQVNGVSPRQMAREIRQHIGLTDGQAKAVLNYRAKLDKMMSEGKSPFKTKPLTTEKIDSLVDKYNRKLLKYRSETIAREETIRACKEGQHNILNQSLEQGLLDTATHERYWIVTRDDRLCPRCRPMGGVTAELDQPYQTPIGPVMQPHLHITCRCNEGIRRKPER